jgi:hypothetical protein
MENQETLHQEKTAHVDKALLKWIVHCGSERFLLDISIIMGQTEVLHEELGVSPYFGWFSRFG